MKDGEAAESVTPPTPAQVDSFVAQEMARLRGELESIRRELVELRMDKRKVILEELARLEEPLVEQGVIAQRTRPPRHRSGRLPDGDGG